jgi:hypothetical protein
MSQKDREMGKRGMRRQRKRKKKQKREMMTEIGTGRGEAKERLRR